MKPCAKIQRWAEKADELARIKAEELQLRLELVEEYFGDARANGGEGTCKVDVGAGHELVAKFGLNYRLPAEDKVRPVLERMAKADPAGHELAHRLVKWTADLRVGELKKLPAKLGKLLEPILMVTPATPSLELRSPN